MVLFCKVEKGSLKFGPSLTYAFCHPVTGTIKTKPQAVLAVISSEKTVQTKGWECCHK